MAETVSFQDANISMEELLNNSGMHYSDIEPGSVVTGKIVGFQPEINPEMVIIDMGSKSEGKISYREFDTKPRIGEEIEALAKSVDKETGLVLLSCKALERLRGWEIVQEIFEKELPVTGIVKRSMKNGYMVNIEGVAMFLPHSHLGSLVTMNRGGKKPDIIGQAFTVKILELDNRKKTGVVSRKIFQDVQNDQMLFDHPSCLHTYT